MFLTRAVKKPYKTILQDYPQRMKRKSQKSEFLKTLLNNLMFPEAVNSYFLYQIIKYTILKLCSLFRAECQLQPSEQI